jgi:hypothetical protein
VTETVRRRRIDILVDAPLMRRVTAAADAAGVSGYTISPTLSGMGTHGRWSDDQLTGAAAKQWFVTVTAAEKADALVDALVPLLDTHGLLLMLSDVEVVRGGKF